MRALTVRQPWAWAIIHGGKDVENRSRNLAGSYRGPVAIHAALVEDEAAYDDPMIVQALGEQADSWYLLERMATGAFLGIVDLVDVHEAYPERHAFGNNWQAACCSSPWGQSDAGVHLVRANPRPLPEPIPARGRLGLWTPPADVLELLEVAR